MKTEPTPAFIRAFDRLSAEDQGNVAEAYPRRLDAFGKPHAHLGLRKMGRQLYEFRVGLRLRMVFRHETDTLYLLLVGTHNEVRRFLQSL